MLTLKIGEKELQIKFGYEATLKTRLLSKIANMTAKNKSNSENEANDNLENVEDMLLFIPEVVLIGLQKFHSDEFGFNLDTKEGYENQKEKVFGLVAEYIDGGEVDCVEFFNKLQEELMQNGFLAKMFRGELQKAEQKS